MPRQWTGAALFTFALLSIPFDIAGLWAGTIRYPVRSFLLFVAAGRVFSVTAIDLAGFYGISLLFE